MKMMKKTIFTLLLISSAVFAQGILPKLTVGKIQLQTNTISSSSGDIILSPLVDLQISNQTASTVPYLDASKKVKSSAVTPTELGRLSGVLSALCGTSDSCTLTNKSISGSTNTITNVSLTSGVTGTLPIANGGTGQTTSAAAINALLPTQTSNSGKFLTTDGSAASWATTGGTVSYVAKTANYTVLTSDDVLAGDASGGNFTFTLFTAVGNAGKVLRFKRTDQTFANKITIDGNGTETIDGALTRLLKTQNEEFTIISDGANWKIISHTYPKGKVAWTPTGSWTTDPTTGVTYSGFWKRDGDEFIGDVFILCNATVSGVPLYINLLSGLTINSAKLSSGTTEAALGQVGNALDAGAASYNLYSFYRDTTSVWVFAMNVAGTYATATTTTNAAPFTFNTGDSVRINFRVPIVDWEE